MALAPDVTSSTDPNPLSDDAAAVDAPGLQYFVFGLFFIFGGITSLNDVLIPKLKELFTLSYTEAMLVQFCFFAAYLLIGIPGAKLVKKIGYMRGAVAGLCTMIVGCLLFIPASQTATYAIFLGALFILASGVVIVQVVANPLISLLGPPSTTHSRLTFAQAFNSLGTTVFPIVGAAVILGTLANVTADQLQGAELQAYRAAESEAIWQGYLGVAALIAVVAAAVWMFRNRLPHDAKTMGEGELVSVGPLLHRTGSCRHRCVRRLASQRMAGCIADYLAGTGVLALRQRPAEAYPLRLRRAVHLPVCGRGSVDRLHHHQLPFTCRACSGPARKRDRLDDRPLLGRCDGGPLHRVRRLADVQPRQDPRLQCHRRDPADPHLHQQSGEVAAYTLLAVGLMNSIMFPTIFSLACEKLGPRAADGSGIINVAIFGGAVVPLLYGVMADATGGNLALAMVIPIVCYAIIAGFGMFARRPA